MKLFKIKLLVIAVIVFAASSAFADFSKSYTFDTSSISGTVGYIDFQLSPGVSYAGPATAAITNFTTNGTLVTVDPTQFFGTASGDLLHQVTNPVTVTTLDPMNQSNEFIQAFTFGSTVKFDLTLSGAAGSSFGLLFYDGSYNALLSNPGVANGYALTVDMNSDGTFTENVAASPTPVPAAVYLLGSGLMGLVGIRRRKRK